MSIIASYRHGLREGITRPQIALLLWLFNFVLAGLVAYVFAAPLSAYFGQSLSLDDLMASFDVNTLLEFVAAEGGVVGDVGRMLFLSILAYTLAWPFFQGGILQALTVRPREGGQAAAFFAGGGKYYGRFLRLEVLSIGLWFGAFLVFTFLSALLGFLAPDPDAEYLRFVLVLVRILVVLVLFNFVRMILDYARIATVRADSRRMLAELARAVRFVVSRMGSTAGLYGLFVLTALPFLVGYAVLRLTWPQTTPAAVAGVFFLGQIFIFLRGVLRVAWQAGQWSFYGLFKTPKGPGRQGDQRLDQVEPRVDGDAQEPEGEKKEPDKRIEDESEESQGPAEDEKDEP
jgi:hypothetical protein